MPPGSPYFVGREGDLRDLLAVLDGGNALVRASMEGLPGVGKTELAIQLARQASREGRFPGGICWLNAENPDLTLEWDRIGEAMGQPGAPGVERAQATLATLRRSTGRILLVMDNVTTWSHTKHPSPLPEGEHVRLLATTRQGELGGTLFRHHRLQFLPPAAAATLLRDVAGRDIPGAEALLAHLEGHALAVELAGAFLRAYPDVSAAEYLEELKAGDPSKTVADRTRYEATVEQALGSLWERIDTSLRHAWAVAACFEPEAVSVPLAEACGLNRELRRRLRELHLVEDAGGGRPRMHRLVRAFGLAKGDVAARRAFVEGGLSLTDGVNLEVGYRILAADRSHLEALVGGGPGWAEASLEERSLLLDRVGTALHSGGLFDPARKLFERALEGGLQNLGQDHPNVASHRSNLALVLTELGELSAARALLEQALASDLRNLGEDHPTVAIRRSNLATVLKALGDLPTARALLEQALASDLRNLGEDHPNVARSRSNLATVLNDLGDLPAARALLEQALASDLRNLGEDHPNVAIKRSNLAGVHRDLGDLAAARALLEQALTSDLRNLGEAHPNVALRRANLATVLHDLGDLPAARALSEEALAGGLRTFGEDHPSVATRRSNLAAVLYDLGDLPTARALLEQALASDLRNLGEDHPNVALRRSNLATVVQNLGDLPSARALLEQGLASELRTLGEDHPDVATSRAKLAKVLWKLGDYAEAAALERQVIAAHSRQLGTDHPEVARARLNLAFTLRDLGDAAAAAQEATEALRIARLQPEGSQTRVYVEKEAPSFLSDPHPSPR